MGARQSRSYAGREARRHDAAEERDDAAVYPEEPVPTMRSKRGEEILDRRVTTTRISFRVTATHVAG
jgi:hypothetical protein